jgi:hypothetical protein
MNKLALVNFSQSQAKVREANDLLLTQSTSTGITKHQLKAKPHAKLLGVILDSKLNWTIQHERVREKATKFTAAFKRYTRSALGIRPSEALQLYNAVAVPRICYAADIWYKPPIRKKPQGRQQGSVRLTRQLESIQRQAAISIIGTMRTTAGDTSIVHANMRPIAQQLKRISLKAYARLTTRPRNHPLYPAILKTSSHPVQHHKTSLQRLASLNNLEPQDVEQIPPTRAHPSTTSPHIFHIADSKEESIAEDSDRFTKGVMIYTDGSCYMSRVGASAVLYIGSVRIDSIRYQLGCARKHTIFEGELVGIILGTHLASTHPTMGLDINFSIDNQAAIKAMQNNSSQPAQYLIDEIHRCTGLLQ